MTADAFLQLALYGGSIVCSSQCTVSEVATATANGRFYTSPEKGNKDWGFGFLFRPAEQLVTVAVDGEPAPATVGK